MTLESQSNERQLRDMVSKHFEISPYEISPDTHFRHDLEADDLDHLELIMEAEHIFNIEIDDEDVDAIQTFGSLVKCVESLMDVN